ncbi:hypothetical protein J2S00_002676 [Caldalkalibacillus uzonensis]|uniref:SLH domain-containing protein n=1 Tax=Caldalkalibacillus uzonensis TaxID=353224 RepID=A0ABU0CTY5_9BACI|nr:S-layer homology domain-containing protein [Caldalkalibacillus uzonensis]MDQ0339881.1 hypothetical protein [Caldalkalibacillus uzonensis]
MFKRNIVVALLFLMIIIPLVITFYSGKKNQETLFKDVSPNDENYDFIQQAVKQKLLTGYADGTFKPDKPVTEAEFLAMLYRAYYPEQEDNDRLGIKKYYNWAESQRWKIFGKDSRQRELTLVDVSVLLANALGYHLSEDGSVQLLLDKGLLNEVAGPDFETFYNTKLTRIQALKLITNLREKVDHLQKRPLHPSEEPAIKSEFVDIFTPVEKWLIDQNYDYRLTVWARELGVIDNEKEIIYANYFHEHSPYNFFVLYEAQPEYVNLAHKIFEKMNIKMDVGKFSKAVKTVIEERKSSFIEVDDWTVTFSAGNTDEMIQVHFYKLRN